jgi:AcrR family transcriptional regulator
MPRQRTSLTREDWVAAARKTFVASGIDDVKVDRLARRLKISRGSFYWHFTSRKDLLDALLRDWESRNRDEIARMTERWGAGAPALADVVGIWLGEDPSFPAYDMAIRIWARKAPHVAAVMRAVDESWIGLLRLCFEADARDETESFARARIVYFHQVGYYALAIRESLEDRIKLAPYYHEILTGRSGGPALAAALDRVRQARLPGGAAPKPPRRKR